MPAPKEGMNCANCYYYEKAAQGAGECRHNAPSPNSSFYVPRTEGIGTIKTDCHWPKVFDANWCGEFQVRQ
jgi:hypothetical protein